MALALLALVPSAIRAGDGPNVDVRCMAEGDDCRTRIIRLPDGLPGQVLKFEYCHEGDCDR